MLFEERPTKFFTLEEARDLLPSVNEWMSKAIAISNRIDSKQGDARLRGIRKIDGYLDHIREAGCFVRSIENGLVDFPSILNDREVYLCWRHGENDISFWHEMNAGFDGRTSLEE